MTRAHHVDAVVKIGGGLLPIAGALATVAAAVAAAAGRHRILVVPGGGPFADRVREVELAVPLGDSAAHWMAVLAMDQFAYLLAAKVAGAQLVESAVEAQAALDAGAVPVLAPSRWLREADPLPHSWAVTSDSIAAWVAGATGAPRLVLVKPSAGEISRLVDEHFSRALPAGVQTTVVAASSGADFARCLEVALGG
jgi:5-(aminomethyl)-3-furanmethanol phosphate kinase